jgi:hypothetical protein
MIKKITLIAVFGLFSGLSLQAQSLANTYWSGSLSGSPTYINFKATDVDIAFSDITFGNVATYTESGTTLSLTDVSGTCFDVGTYTIAYSGNAVTFTTINEPCTASGREAFFTSGPFTQTSISVYEAAKFEFAKLFPNPTSNLIYLELDETFSGQEFVIVNTQGQSVSEGTLTSGRNTIAVEELKSGLYMLQLKNNGRATIKFVKQ